MIGRAAVVAVVAGVALAAPAAATEGEDRFIADMERIGLSADHGYVDSNARDDRPILNQGYQVCDMLTRGYSLLDAERNIINTEMADRTAGNGRDISREKISVLVNSAKGNLCP